MAVKLSPLFNPDSAQIDANGTPRASGLLFTYLAGTSTKATTYQDSAGSVPHANPIVLSANGLAPAPIWLTTGSSYKFVLAPAGDTDPPASAILTIDNVAAVNDLTTAAADTEWTASGMTPTQTGATTFTVSGDQTTVLHVGRRLKTVNTGGTYYGAVIRSVHSAGTTTVTVLLDSGSLDSGLSAFSYGIASADNTSLPFISRDQQCGRLVYVSTTSIRLDPQDGNTIWVYSGSNWRRRIIPSAGITMANTGLAANNAYFIYLYDNAGVLTMEASATAPAVDATSGLKIKTGDPTRLLVGMVKVNADTPGLFQTPGLVLSWYKRRAIAVAGTALTGPPTSNSTSVVELQAAAQAKFMSWAEEAVLAQFTGWSLTDGAARTAFTQLTLDGVVTAFSPQVSGTSYTANAQDNASCAGYGTVTEGYHYITIAVQVSATTVGTWASGGILYVITQG
jgi:hypothetical protein